MQRDLRAAFQAAAREPRLVDGDGERPHAEIFGRADVVDRLHEHQRDAGDDRRLRHRQKDAPEHLGRTGARACARHRRCCGPASGRRCAWSDRHRGRARSTARAHSPAWTVCQGTSSRARSGSRTGRAPVPAAVRNSRRTRRRRRRRGRRARRAAAPAPTTASCAAGIRRRRPSMPTPRRRPRWPPRQAPSDRCVVMLAPGSTLRSRCGQSSPVPDSAT